MRVDVCSDTPGVMPLPWLQALFPPNGSPWSAGLEQSLGTGDLVSTVEVPSPVDA